MRFEVVMAIMIQVVFLVLINYILHLHLLNLLAKYEVSELMYLARYLIQYKGKEVAVFSEEDTSVLLFSVMYVMV
jgi:hypothetical protein